jgi:small subunit ribosomal protein S18
MARPSSPSSNKRSRTAKDSARRPGKKKVCTFCADRSSSVDYKDSNVLRRFISDRGKIKARRVSGLCVQHQREVSIAVKTARELALLPYSVRASAERGRGGGRGRDGDRGPRPIPVLAIDADMPALPTIDGDIAVIDVAVDVAVDVDVPVDVAGEVAVDVPVEVAVDDESED